MNNQKGLVNISLIILGLLVIGAGSYFYINNITDNEYNNTEEFTNTPRDEESENNQPESTGKSTHQSQEEQTSVREKSAGIKNLIDEYGILFSLEPVYPYFPKYKLPINITGYVSDIKWGIFEGEAGSVSVYDSDDTLLGQTSLTLIDFDYDKEPPFYFDVMVGDREWMSNLDTDIGYVIVREAGAKNGEVLVEIRVPVEFYFETQDTYEELPSYNLSAPYDNSMFLGGSIPGNAIITPDGKKLAIPSYEGLITIYDLETKSKMVIDVLNGVIGVPGFTVPDYSNNGKQRAYYNGHIVFLDNNNILYPTLNNEYVIENIDTRVKTAVKGDVSYSFEDKYFVYQKKVANGEETETKYILYENDSKNEIHFFSSYYYRTGVININYCKDIISFVSKTGNWPKSENSDFIYYRFDTKNKILINVGEGNSFQPDENLLKEINNCN